MNAKSASTYFDISTAGDESPMSKQKERVSLRARRFIFRNFTASSFKGRVDFNQLIIAKGTTDPGVDCFNQ